MLWDEQSLFPIDFISPPELICLNTYLQCFPLGNYIQVLHNSACSSHHFLSYCTYFNFIFFAEM